MKVQDLIKASRPFIIVEYYEWLTIKPDERFKTYEVIFHKESNERFTSCYPASFKDVQRFKDYLVLKQEDKNGRIWEFMEFKHYFERKKLEWY
jgi:hypothetical protein